MSTARSLTGILVAAAVGAAVALASRDAGAVSRMAPQPTRVATVDLVKVIERLKERSDWEMQINALGKKIQDEYSTRRKALEELAKKMETAAEAERGAMRDKLAFDQLQLQQWETLKKVEVDRERALMWQSMYRNVRNESQKLAEAEGWDVVLVNDGVNDIQLQRDSKSPLEAQAQEQIVRRRVLFAGRTTDVTDQLVVRLNNARGAAQPADAAGGAPAPAAPAAPAK